MRRLRACGRWRLAPCWQERLDHRDLSVDLPGAEGTTAGRPACDAESCVRIRVPCGTQLVQQTHKVQQDRRLQSPEEDVASSQMQLLLSLHRGL